MGFRLLLFRQQTFSGNQMCVRDNENPHTHRKTHDLGMDNTTLVQTMGDRFGK